MMAPVPAPVGVILAGGRATRMGGGDKGRLHLGGRPILARVVERFRPQVAALVLNANGAASRFDDLGLEVVADGVAGFAGPLAGVLAGMDWAAAQGAVQVVSVAGDTPFLPCDLVPRLLLAAETEDRGIALAATRGGDGRCWRHPTFGLWPVALRDDLRDALGRGLRKVVDWTDGHGAATAMFDATVPDPFFNVNTPDDLAAAQAWA